MMVMMILGMVSCGMFRNRTSRGLACTAQPEMVPELHQPASQQRLSHLQDSYRVS